MCALCQCARARVRSARCARPVHVYLSACACACVHILQRCESRIRGASRDLGRREIPTYRSVPNTMTWNYYSVGPETPSNLASSVCKIEAPPSPCDYRGVPNTRSITRYKHLNKARMVIQASPVGGPRTVRRNPGTPPVFTLILQQNRRAEPVLHTLESGPAASRR